jgi:hypothetical protein
MSDTAESDAALAAQLQASYDARAAARTGSAHILPICVVAGLGAALVALEKETEPGTGGSTEISPVLERLERALAAISYAILLDGPVYAPVLDRIEREIAAVRTSGDVVSRARQHLDRLRNHAAIGNARRVKAIA